MEIPKSKNDRIFEKKNFFVNSFSSVLGKMNEKKNTFQCGMSMFCLDLISEKQWQSSPSRNVNCCNILLSLFFNFDAVETE